MDYEESVAIVQKYLDTLNESPMYHDISELPCSPVRLKNALCIFTENIIREYARNPEKYDPFEELIPSLQRSYAEINVRFLHQGKEINKYYKDLIIDKKYKGDKLKKVVDQFEADYDMTITELGLPIPDPVANAEFHNFVAEILETTNL